MRSIKQLRNLFFLSLILFLLPEKAFASYYSVSEDLMTDRKKIYIEEISINDVLNSIGMPEKAKLIIRCNGDDVDAFISTTTYNANNTQVGLRWSGGTPLKTRWSESTSGTALFSPSPEEFIRQLLKNESLVFQWKPYSEIAKAAKFNLKDLKLNIEKGRKDGCNF